MRNLLGELRRRKVLRVAGAYVVLGWVLIQVADTLAPMMNLPDSAPRFVLFLLIMLFPVAIFMAWALELRPQDGEDLTRDAAGRSVLGVGLAILIAAVLGWYLLWGPPEETVTAPELATTGQPQRPAMAVLPFLDLSPSGDQQYFGDGIAEELLNVLSALEQLEVASRTSAFAFREENRNVAEIARILGVTYVLEGSVRKASDRVRITAQLIDAGKDRHLWSETFDRELTADNVFAIQDEIAGAIVVALEDELGLDVASGVSVLAGTSNMDAYDLYLRAQQLGRIVSIDNVRTVVELLERAVELDPGFGEAWALLSQWLVFLPTWDHGLDAELANRRAIEVARHALAINPESVPAYDALEGAYFALHEWDAYEAVVEEALAKLPAVVRDPEELMGLGYFDRAIPIVEQASTRAPDMSFYYVLEGVYHQAKRRPREAIDAFETAILKGYEGGADSNLASSFMAQGESAVTVALLSKGYEADDPELLPLLPHIVALLEAVHGNFEQAAERFRIVVRELGFSEQDLLRRGPRWGLRTPPVVAMAFGRFDAITDQFWGNSPMFWMWAPDLQRWRKSDSFRDRVRESGMLAYWQKHGWPDFCRPDGAGDFKCD